VALSIEEILRKRISLLENAPSLFEQAVEANQRKILIQVLKDLGSLDTKAGFLTTTATNLRKLDNIIAKLRDVLLKGDYLETVRSFAKSFDEAASLSDQYFKKAFADYEPSDLAKEILKRNKRAAIEQLIGSPLDAQFIRPVEGILDNAVSTGASWRDTVKAIEDFITGDSQRHGKLLSYTKQIVSDTLSITDAVYSNQAAMELEAVWWFYTGGIIQDTRCFCEQRNNKYFHQKEVEAWGRGETEEGDLESCGFPWQGMIPQTNEKTVFILRGGYNCKHSLIPVSAVVVPRDVLERNISSGNFEPTDFERTELGL